MKYIKSYEEIHYLNIPVQKNYEFIIDVKYASENQINEAFDEFEKYTKIDDWDKKYLTSKDNVGKVWAWRIELHKSYFNDNASIHFGIITTPNWGIGDHDVVDDRITVQEFLAIGLENVKEYIAKGDTYFKVLSRLGYGNQANRIFSKISPEEFVEVGPDADELEKIVNRKILTSKYNI